MPFSGGGGGSGALAADVRIEDGASAQLATVLADGALAVNNDDFPEAAALADALGIPTTTVLEAVLGAFNGATFDLLRSGGDNADAQAVATLGLLKMLCRQYGFNGTTWDRLKTANAPNSLVGVQRVMLSDINGANTPDQLSNLASDSIPSTFAGIGRMASVQMGFDGTNWQRARIANVFKALSAVSTNAEATIWTPTSGKKFRLMGYHLTSSVAGNIILKDNTAGTIIAIVPSGAGGSGVFVLLGNGILSAAANNLLTATGPAASTTSGIVFGTEE